MFDELLYEDRIMSDPVLADIVTQCLVLEKKAIQIYKKLRELTKEENLKAFWSEMCAQEVQHVQYWKDLCDAVREKTIPNIFDHPADIQNELKDVGKKVDAILEGYEDLSDTASAFLVAYRTEFFLLHPAFEALFFLMRNITGDTSPEDGYRAHIQGLIETMRRQGQNRPEFELIAALAGQLWDRNQRLAKQMADIKQLRGLLPICMHCKKIRDDQGFWQQVEHYIEHHADVAFSHGICTDCMKKYYPEIYQDLESSRS
jgi:rubrerythrin